MKFGFSTLKKSGLFLFAFLASSCVEPLGTGAKVDLPYVMIECKTPQCLSAGAWKRAIVKITSAGCDPQYDQWASASTSFMVQCNAITGCWGSSSEWIDALGDKLKQLPTGFYTVCGFIDFDNNYPINVGQHTKIEIQSLWINGVNPIWLTNWSDP